MMKIILSVFFAVAGLFGLLVWSELPVVMARNAEKIARKIANLSTIELSGTTLFVSDFHLTNPFLRTHFTTEGLDNIVIVGDFFHSERHFESFGDNVQERIQKGLLVFLPTDFAGNVYFISAFTHDPQLELFEFEHGSMRFFHVGKAAKFSINGTKVVALHGNELHNGIVGGGVSWLFSKFGLPLPLERLGKRYYGIAKDTWFIAGHSHVPGIHQESKTANSGSFVGVPLNSLIFKLPIGTGIMFENGKTELLRFDAPRTSNIYWIP